MSASELDALKPARPRAPRRLCARADGLAVRDHRAELRAGVGAARRVAAAARESLPLEMEVDGKTFLFQVVAVPEFDFVNIYGTDVTAARDNEQILRKLAKYFSPQVYESIFSGDLEVKIQTKRKRLTVFFSVSVARRGSFHHRLMGLGVPSE